MSYLQSVVDSCFPISNFRQNLEISKFVERLEILAETLECYSVQKETHDLEPLAELLASDFCLEHSNPEIQLLIASCISDVFRLCLPRSSFSKIQLKKIFSLFTNVLMCQPRKKSSRFKHYLHLLQNVAKTKVFNLCFELQEHDDIMEALFSCFIEVVSNEQNPQLSDLALDVLVSLLNDVDEVSAGVFDIILCCLLKPVKTDKASSYHFIRNLVLRTSKALEQPLWKFFSSAFEPRQSSKISLCLPVADLVEELDSLCPTLIEFVCPLLQSALESHDDSARILSTHLVGKLFGKSNSILAEQQRCLWSCFVNRFSDRCVSVRRACIQASRELLAYHKELVMMKTNGLSICERLCHCRNDPNEYVRIDVIRCIVGAVQLSVNCLNDSLLDYMKQRLMDKKEIVRQEAAEGLGIIFKCYLQEYDVRRLVGIQNAVLRSYAAASTTSDRLLLECLFRTAFLRGNLGPKAWMKHLLMLYCVLDDISLKSFHEILRRQRALRTVLASLLGLCRKRGANVAGAQFKSGLSKLLRCLSVSSSCCAKVKTFLQLATSDPKLSRKLSRLFDANLSSSDIEDCIAEVLQSVRATSSDVIGQVLEKLTLFVVTKREVLYLTREVCRLTFEQSADTDSESALFSRAATSGANLLLVLSNYFHESFENEETYAKLLSIIKDQAVSEIVIQIFTNCGKILEDSFPHIFEEVLPILLKFITAGSLKQSKCAIHCVASLTTDHLDSILQPIFKQLRISLDKCSPNLTANLAAVGHLMYVCPSSFSKYGPKIKDFVVEYLFQLKSNSNLKTKDAHNIISSALQIQGLKVIMRWLMRIKVGDVDLIMSTIQIFFTVLCSDTNPSPCISNSLEESSSVRLQAGCCLLKVAQNPVCEEHITPEQFHTLALLMNDPCLEVRSVFANKLNKGLQSLRLPLSYMSFFCLGALDPDARQEAAVKRMLNFNIAIRRDYMTHNRVAKGKVLSVLPEYVLPYAIHLLAHDPDLTSHRDSYGLRLVNQCLSFLLDALFPKSDCVGVTFCKRICDKIPFAKDGQSPKSAAANAKLHSVCEAALNLLIRKEIPDALVRLPAEPVLPTKFFTYIDNKVKKPYSNPPKVRRYKPSVSVHISFISSLPRLHPAVIPGNSGHRKQPIHKDVTISVLNSEIPDPVENISAGAGPDSLSSGSHKESSKSCNLSPQNPCSSDRKSCQRLNSRSCVPESVNCFNSDVLGSGSGKKSASSNSWHSQRRLPQVGKNLASSHHSMSSPTSREKDTNHDFSSMSSPLSLNSVPMSSPVSTRSLLASNLDDKARNNSSCSSKRTLAYQTPSSLSSMFNSQCEAGENGEICSLCSEVTEAVSGVEVIDECEKQNDLIPDDATVENCDAVLNRRLSTVISDLQSAMLSSYVSEDDSASSPDIVSVLEYIDSSLAVTNEQSERNNDGQVLVESETLASCDKFSLSISNEQLNVVTVVGAVSTNGHNLSKCSVASSIRKSDSTMNNDEPKFDLFEDCCTTEECLIPKMAVNAKAAVDNQTNCELPEQFLYHDDECFTLLEPQAQPREEQPREAQPKEAQPREAQPKEAQPREAQPSEAKQAGAETSKMFSQTEDFDHESIFSLVSQSQVEDSQNSASTFPSDRKIGKSRLVDSTVITNVQFESCTVESCRESLQIPKTVPEEHCTTALDVHVSQSRTTFTPALYTNRREEKRGNLALIKSSEKENEAEVIPNQLPTVFDKNLLGKGKRFCANELINQVTDSENKTSNFELKSKSSVTVTDLSLSPNRQSKKDLDLSKEICLPKHSNNLRDFNTNAEEVNTKSNTLNHSTFVQQNGEHSVQAPSQCPNMPSEVLQRKNKSLKNSVASVAFENRLQAASAVNRSLTITARSSVVTKPLSVTGSTSNSQCYLNEDFASCMDCLEISVNTSAEERRDEHLSMTDNCYLSTDFDNCKIIREIRLRDNLSTPLEIDQNHMNDQIRSDASLPSVKNLTELHTDKTKKENDMLPEERSSSNLFDAFAENVPKLPKTGCGRLCVSSTESKTCAAKRHHGSTARHHLTSPNNFFQHSKANTDPTVSSNLKSSSKVLSYSDLQPAGYTNNVPCADNLPRNLSSANASECNVNLSVDCGVESLKSETFAVRNRESLSTTNASNTQNHEIVACDLMSRHASVPVTSFIKESLLSKNNENKQVVDSDKTASSKMSNFTNSVPENQYAHTMHVKNKHSMNTKPKLKGQKKVKAKERHMSEVIIPFEKTSVIATGCQSAGALYWPILPPDEFQHGTIASEAVSYTTAVNHQTSSTGSGLIRAQSQANDFTRQQREKGVSISEYQNNRRVKVSTNKRIFHVQKHTKGECISKPKCSITKKRMKIKDSGLII